MIRILHVEDDPDILEILRIALEFDGGFHLLQFDRGEDAIENGPAFGPDLLLLDVTLPGMSGPQVLKQMRSKTELEATPAVFVTARAQTAEVSFLMAEGAIAVITKPFDPVALGPRLREIHIDATA